VVCGAVQAVLAHPTNVNICFAGTANGGVWVTETCTQPLPDWSPITESEDSLSVADIAFDSTDPTGNTVLVGIGSRSAFKRLGGPSIGILYTTNALSKTPTWKVLNNDAGTVNFAEINVKFSAVFARGDLMLASAESSDIPVKRGECPTLGLFRSVNGGVTWTNVLPGIGRAIAADPNDPDRFYAAMDSVGNCSSYALSPSIGVFTSVDAGLTWSGTNPDSTITEGSLSNAKLSVSADADGSRVWSGLIRRIVVDDVVVEGVVGTISYSDSEGTSWTKMDQVLIPNTDGPDDGLHPEKAGGQGNVHFSMLSNPEDKNEIFVGGDRQNDPFPNTIGAILYSGILFRGNASVTSTGDIPSPQWEHMTDNITSAIPGGGTASASAPHPDSRDMEIRADGAIIEGDDGGIVLRSRPSDNTGDWFSLCGNMIAFEAHSVAYDPTVDGILFGTQDNGSILHIGGAGTTVTLSWADGINVLIDYESEEPLVHYYVGMQELGVLTRVTRYPNQAQTRKDIGKELSGKGAFRTLMVMNPVAQNHFAIAVKEDDSTPINRITTTVDRGDFFSAPQETKLELEITAMAWSGDGKFLYAVDLGGLVSRCTVNSLTIGCTPMGKDEGLLGRYVHSLVVDPSKSNELFLVAVKAPGDFRNPAVFKSINGGDSWDDITISGSPVAEASLGGAVAFIHNPSVGASSLVVGTSSGIFKQSNGGWTLLAKGIPKLPIMQMIYNLEDDVLVVATMGKSVMLSLFDCFLQRQSTTHITSNRPNIDRSWDLET
jgi:hypothetical protein